MADSEERKEQEDKEEVFAWRTPWDAIRRLKECDSFFDHKCTLTRSTFFAGRSQFFLKALVETLSVEIFPPGKDIIKEGEVGERAYFLNRGKVGVYIEHGRMRVAELAEGNVFGEMAIFGNGKRSATVRAEDLCDCRVIQFIPFQQLMRSFPQEQAHFEQIAAQRLAQTQEAKRKQLNKRRFASAAKMAVVMQPKASPAVGARRSSDAALTLKKSLPSMVSARRASEIAIRLPGLDTSRSPPGSARGVSPTQFGAAGSRRSSTDQTGGLLLASGGDAAASSKVSSNVSSEEGPHQQVRTDAPLKPSKLPALAPRSISDITGSLRLNPQSLRKSPSASSLSSNDSSLSSNPPEKLQELEEPSEQEERKEEAEHFSVPAVDDTPNFSPSFAANDFETAAAKLESPGTLILQSRESTAIATACKQDSEDVSGEELTSSQQLRGYRHCESEERLHTAEEPAAISACEVTPPGGHAGSQRDADTSDLSKSSNRPLQNLLAEGVREEEGANLQHVGHHLQYRRGKFCLEPISPKIPERPGTPRSKAGMWWRSRASCANSKRDRSVTMEAKETEASGMMFGRELLKVGP
eukprot:TRINITY_DN2143_c0_g1_i8.p1 TRINITY_DN2143_c0_g1~~TRINITY_DN2143_c0_g1_i8.p1  ORF type:complete len:582 (-),score=128.80 TRINITY_DN2143_c0_g1_i8:151-1896(-)